MQRNILLVDDEAGIIHAIRRMLRSEPYLIHEAASGDEALAILERHDIQLMITDYKMPGMDGLTLCRKTRELSPTTYRLLLSGQVDYSALRRAWQHGDVHRFVAKPWDNLLLTMDIKEGLKQHTLLSRMHQLSQQLQTQQPTLLTDRNWIVRLANAPMCRALQCREEDLLGVNLFAQALSDMAVTLETEVTRQVEENKTWLGHFTLTGPAQLKKQAWMAIAPLGDQYRLCSCHWVSDDLNPQRDLSDELKRYSGEHHLERLQQAADQSLSEPQLMVVSFCDGSGVSRDLSAMCYERLQAATDDLYEIYSPSPSAFLILLPAAIGSAQTTRLTQNIQQDFSDPLNYQGQPLVLEPDISIESKPADISDWDDWLRLRLGLGMSQATRPHSYVAGDDQPQPQPVTHSDNRVLPVFNQQGELSALQIPAEAFDDGGSWHSWLQDVVSTWQRHFQQPLQLIINAADHAAADIRALTDELQQSGNPARCSVILAEECVLSQDDEDLSWRDELRARQCNIFIANFGRSFINSRQLLALPIQGVSLAPEFLIHMRNSKSLPQSRRLLQRIHDHGMTIFAPNMDSTESLASAHQSNVDWLSGSILSQTLSCDQLQWFSADGGIG